MKDQLIETVSSNSEQITQAVRKKFHSMHQIIKFLVSRCVCSGVCHGVCPSVCVRACPILCVCISGVMVCVSACVCVCIRGGSPGSDQFWALLIGSFINPWSLVSELWKQFSISCHDFVFSLHPAWSYCYYLETVNIFTELSSPLVVQFEVYFSFNALIKGVTRPSMVDAASLSRPSPQVATVPPSHPVCHLCSQNRRAHAHQLQPEAADGPMMACQRVCKCIFNRLPSGLRLNLVQSRTSWWLFWICRLFSELLAA